RDAEARHARGTHFALEDAEAVAVTRARDRFPFRGFAAHRERAAERNAAAGAGDGFEVLRDREGLEDLLTERAREALLQGRVLVAVGLPAREAAAVDVERRRVDRAAVRARDRLGHRVLVASFGGGNRQRARRRRTGETTADGGTAARSRDGLRL